MFNDLAKIGKLMGAANELKAALKDVSTLDVDADGVADIKEIEEKLASLLPLEKDAMAKVKALFTTPGKEPSLGELYAAAGPDLMKAFTTLESVGELLEKDFDTLKTKYGAEFANIVAGLA